MRVPDRGAARLALSAAVGPSVAACDAGAVTSEEVGSTPGHQDDRPASAAAALRDVISHHARWGPALASSVAVSLAIWIPTMATQARYGLSSGSDALWLPLMLFAPAVLGAIFRGRWWAIALGLTAPQVVLAPSTMPRGDTTGMWVLVFPMLFFLFFVAAVVAYVATMVTRSLQRRSGEFDNPSIEQHDYLLALFQRQGLSAEEADAVVQRMKALGLWTPRNVHELSVKWQRADRSAVDAWLADSS